MYADFPCSSILSHLRGCPAGMRGPPGLPSGCALPAKLTTFSLDRGDAAAGWPASSAFAAFMLCNSSAGNSAPDRPVDSTTPLQHCRYMTCPVLRESQQTKLRSVFSIESQVGGVRCFLQLQVLLDVKTQSISFTPPASIG